MPPVLDDGAARKRFAAGSDLMICACSKGYFCAHVSGSVPVYWLLFFSIPILRRKVSERWHWILFQLKFIWLSRSRGSEVRDTAHAVLTRENVAIVRCIPSHVVLHPICRLGIADSRQIPDLEDRNRRQNQSKVPALFAAMICAFSINVQADDGKIISSAICQAMTPNGAEHLRHLGSSLQAVGADVTVICPIADKTTVVDEANPGAATRDVISADIPKLIDRKMCTPTIRSALGRSPLAGDRRDGLGHSVARKRAPTGPSAAMSSLPTAPSSSIERRAHQPMRSALGRRPLAGDRRDGLGLSVARKRAPTGPGAAMSSLPTAPSSSIERCAHQPMRSALGRSPLAGDRRDGLGLSVARKRAPTDPGAAMSSLPTAPSSSIERCAHQPMRSALGRSPLAGDRRDGLGLSVARKRAPTGPSAAMSSLPTARSSSIERCAHQPMRSALGRSPLAGDRRNGLGLSVARKRAPTGPSAAMSSLPTAPSSSIERRADQPMRSALGRSPLAGDRRDGLGLLRRPQAGSYRSQRGNVISADSPKLIERKTCRPKPMRSALGRSPLAGDRRDGLGLSVARKRAPTGPGAAMSSLPTAPSSSSERRADQNPCARLWAGARLRATVAMASDSPSPASGLLPVPARQCHLCRLPQAHRSKDVHTNPCARPWVGARLRATVAMASGSPSPASGLLPIPARQCHLCQQPQAHRSKDVHTNHTLGPG